MGLPMRNSRINVEEHSRDFRRRFEKEVSR